MKSKNIKNVKCLKILLFVFLAFVLTALASFFGIKYGAYLYLSSKYDAPVSDFKLVQFTPKNFQVFEYADVWGDYKFYTWIDSNWKFEHKGREFNVDFIGLKYFDDYQLEDLEKWATEYLSKNIDENIIGIDLRTSDVYFYRTIKADYSFFRSHYYSPIHSNFLYFNMCTNKKWNKSQIKDFLEQAANHRDDSIFWLYNASCDFLPLYSFSIYCKYSDIKEIWKRENVILTEKALFQQKNIKQKINSRLFDENYEKSTNPDEGVPVRFYYIDEKKPYKTVRQNDVVHYFNYDINLKYDVYASRIEVAQ